MKTTISSDALTRVCNILTEARKPTAPRVELTRFELALLADGVATNSDIGDYLITSEFRAYSSIEYFFEELFAPLEIAQQFIFRRPVDPLDEVHGTQGLSAVDATAFLIGLQGLGLQVDPSRLVEKLSDALKDRHSLTGNELEIVLYGNYVNRRRVVLKARPTESGGAKRETTHEDEAGFRFAMQWEGDSVVKLEVLGSLYEVPKPQEHVKCDYCGHEYLTNNTAEARIHQDVHTRRQEMFDPEPEQRFASHLATDVGGERVDHKSPLWMHGAVLERAFEFKREFRYDFVQWPGSSVTRAGEEWVGWLFAADAKGTIAGACAFMNRDAAAAVPDWSLQWVWLAPKFRRSGFLDARWAEFLKLYGDFDIEHPLSEAMQAFVRKHGTEKQKAALPAAVHE
ncbi:hypothetical protein H8F21_15805 [Pseudomonas sp. P66]|uniref:C2H2-type domain-containing protein n=1 Tax=Pseudomonas arcuscaelestis TaxID=2710591 RepID=A0ABS2BZH8_9PSED|nr:hypothetical protein [Pseudomonas arcuscaelestis]MBM5459033.1 hypothetical protein [Pseudomonas arcuscaelestis]